MTYAQKQDGTWRELRATFPVIAADGRQASWETFTALSVEEQEDLGGFVVPEPVTPAGKTETARFLKPTGARPSWNVQYVDAPAPAAPVAPDNPTLGDWRIGLALWKLPDGTTRREDVAGRIKALVESGHPLGPVAQERFEASNNVLRDDLMALRPAMGFSTDDVEESLWRASRVTVKDYSGVWPLPG